MGSPEKWLGSRLENVKKYSRPNPPVQWYKDGWGNYYRLSVFVEIILQILVWDNFFPSKTKTVSFATLTYQQDVVVERVEMVVLVEVVVDVVTKNNFGSLHVKVKSTVTSMQLQANLFLQILKRWWRHKPLSGRSLKQDEEYNQHEALDRHLYSDKNLIDWLGVIKLHFL